MWVLDLPLIGWLVLGEFSLWHLLNGGLADAEVPPGSDGPPPPCLRGNGCQHGNRAIPLPVSRTCWGCQVTCPDFEA